MQCARSFLINDEFLKDDGNTIQVHVAVWMCSSHFVFDGLLAFPSLVLLLLSVEFEFLFQFFVSKGEGGVVGLVFFLSIHLRFRMRNVVCVHYIKIDGDVAEKAS